MCYATAPHVLDTFCNLPAGPTPTQPSEPAAGTEPAGGQLHCPQQRSMPNCITALTSRDAHTCMHISCGAQ